MNETKKHKEQTQIDAKFIASLWIIVNCIQFIIRIANSLCLIILWLAPDCVYTENYLLENPNWMEKTKRKKLNFASRLLYTTKESHSIKGELTKKHKQ